MSVMIFQFLVYALIHCQARNPPSRLTGCRRSGEADMEPKLYTTTITRFMLLGSTPQLTAKSTCSITIYGVSNDDCMRYLSKPIPVIARAKCSRAGPYDAERLFKESDRTMNQLPAQYRDHARVYPLNSAKSRPKKRAIHPRRSLGSSSQSRTPGHRFIGIWEGVKSAVAWWEHGGNVRIPIPVRIMCDRACSNEQGRAPERLRRRRQ
jgi:hypothetical protein